MVRVDERHKCSGAIHAQPCFLEVFPTRCMIVEDGVDLFVWHIPDRLQPFRKQIQDIVGNSIIECLNRTAEHVRDQRRRDNAPTMLPRNLLEKLPYYDGHVIRRMLHSRVTEMSCEENPSDSSSKSPSPRLTIKHGGKHPRPPTDIEALHCVPILTPRSRERLKVDRVCTPPSAGVVGQALGVGHLRELSPSLGRAKMRERARPGTIFWITNGPRDVVIPYLGGRGLGSLGLSPHHRANGHNHHVAAIEMRGSEWKGKRRRSWPFSSCLKQSTLANHYRRAAEMLLRCGYIQIY